MDTVSHCAEVNAQMPVDIETASCPLCKNEHSKLVWLTKDRLYGLPGNFAVVRCIACGLLYLSPRPSSACIHFYYPEIYESFIKQRVEHLPWWQRYSLFYGLWKRCQLVLQYKRNGKLLDLGCGTGQFLAMMRQYSGWEVVGIEPNAEAADFARQTFGLNILTGDLFSAQFPDDYLDVVTMWDVLEHLYEPVVTLQEIGRVLKPDGLLILRTPSLNSLDACLFGRYWAGLDSPRHIAIYSRSTIKLLLDRAGFVLVNLRTGSGSYFIWLLSLQFWTEEIIPIEWLQILLMEIGRNPLTRLIFAIPLFITDYIGLGSEMLVVARPQEVPNSI